MVTEEPQSAETQQRERGRLGNANGVRGELNPAEEGRRRELAVLLERGVETLEEKRSGIRRVWREAELIHREVPGQLIRPPVLEGHVQPRVPCRGKSSSLGIGVE